MICTNVVYFITEIRFQAELQLVLDISRAELEPITAEQEQSIEANHHYYPFLNHEVETMATGMNSSAQYDGQSGYHGDDDDDDDDYVEVSGTHRRSPIFI